MRVSIDPIKGSRGSHLDLHFSKVVPSPWEQARWTGAIDVHVRVTNTGRCYLVQGEVVGEAAKACDRCLKPGRTWLRADIDEEFYPEGKRPADDEYFQDDDGDEDEEDEGNVFTGDSFDLADIVAEYCVMALPAKTVCRSDCRGLCAMCGQNLNEGQCDCEADDVDPRLASLKQLLHPGD